MRLAGFKILIKRAFADGLQGHILMRCRATRLDVFEKPLRSKAVCLDLYSFFAEIVGHIIPAYRLDAPGFEGDPGVPVMGNRGKRDGFGITRKSRQTNNNQSYSQSLHEVIIP